MLEQHNGANLGTPNTGYTATWTSSAPVTLEGVAKLQHRRVLTPQNLGHASLA